MYAAAGRLTEALGLHEEAIAAAASMGMRPSSGLDSLAITLLNLGRFEEARDAWQRANDAEPVREPQDRADATMLDAIFAWADDPHRAMQRLRNADDARQAGWPAYAFQIMATLGRMALRVGDAETAAYAARIIRTPGPTQAFGIEDFHAASIAWSGGLIDPDAAAGARAVASAATVFEKHRFPLRAADAYTDAALIAERAGQRQDAARWQARADEIYASCSAVPVLDRIRATR
jgi:tetratricopeptide (TPR) repeat protein